MALCKRLGVKTTPAYAGGAIIAPILSWHHQSWDTEPDIEGWKDIPPAEMCMMDYHLNVWPAPLDQINDSVAKYMDGLNDASSVQLDASVRDLREAHPDAPLITFSHFVPRLELNPEKRFLNFPYLSKASGSAFLAKRVAALSPMAHIFGHTHFGWDATIKRAGRSTRYIQAALATPAVNDAFEFTLYASSTAGATLTAAASGVTITAAEAYVAAGTRKTFIVYRTAANTYTFLLKSNAPAYSGTGLGKATSVAAATTLNEAQDGHVVAVSTASAITLPSCTSSNLGLTYKILVTAAVAPTVITGTTDVISGFAAKGADFTGAPDITTATTGAVTMTSAALISANTGGAYGEFICGVAGAWFTPYVVANAAPTMT